MEPDVAAFKRGLAGIMVKHQLACFKGVRGAFIGYWGDKDTDFAMYCHVRPSIPPGPFNELFQSPDYDLHELIYDLKSLFDYYGVRDIKNQYLETSFIGPDDNNQFVMEFVDLEFFETKIKGDSNNG